MTATLRVLISALTFCLCASVAYAQSALLQGGPWTSGHVPMYSGPNGNFSQPIIQDSGPAAGGRSGVGLSELGLTERGIGTPPYANAGTGPFNTNVCDYDGPIVSGFNPVNYHYFCFSPNAQGGGLFAYGAVGSATVEPLKFAVNGVTYQFPFTTSGTIGPPSTTMHDIVTWGNGTGTLLYDNSLGFVLNGSSVQGSTTSANPTYTYVGYPLQDGAAQFSNLSTLSTATGAAFTASISGTTMTVTGVVGGTLIPGQQLFGSSTQLTGQSVITSTDLIVSQLSGTTGGIGTYQVTNSQSVTSQSITSAQGYERYAGWNSIQAPGTWDWTPAGTQYGGGFSAIKTNWNNGTTVVGETVGLNVEAFGGYDGTVAAPYGVSYFPGGDTSGILLNINQGYGNKSYVSMIEGDICSLNNGSASGEYCENIVIGPIFPYQDQFGIGMLLSATAGGTLGNAIQIGGLANGSSEWGGALQVGWQYSGTPYVAFKIGASGVVQFGGSPALTHPNKYFQISNDWFSDGGWEMLDSAGATLIGAWSNTGIYYDPGGIEIGSTFSSNQKTLQVAGNTLEIINGANTQNLFSLTDAGNLSVLGSMQIDGIPTSAGSGGLYVCADTSGNLYKKASCP